MEAIQQTPDAPETARVATSLMAYDEIQALLRDIEADVAKTRKGNGAAGTRVRMAALKIGKLTSILRKQVLEVVKSST